LFYTIIHANQVYIGLNLLTQVDIIFKTYKYSQQLLQDGECIVAAVENVCKKKSYFGIF